MALNDKQEKFAQSYILHRNATEAARSAGYSKSSAYNQGYRLLQSDEVKERIEDLEKNIILSFQILGKDKVTELLKQCDFS